MYVDCRSIYMYILYFIHVQHIHVHMYMYVRGLRWGIRNPQIRKKCGLKFNPQIRIHFWLLLGNPQSSNSQSMRTVDSICKSTRPACGFPNTGTCTVYTYIHVYTYILYTCIYICINVTWFAFSPLTIQKFLKYYFTFKFHK